MDGLDSDCLRSFFVCYRNLKTGQLLCRVLLSDGFSHTACLRGYSYSVSSQPLKTNRAPVSLYDISPVCFYVSLHAGSFVRPAATSVSKHTGGRRRRKTKRSDVFRGDEDNFVLIGRHQSSKWKICSGDSTSSTKSLVRQVRWKLMEDAACICAFLHEHVNVIASASAPCRLCEADVNHSSVVGLSQSGCVCMWELGQRGSPKMAGPPEGEVWQLARWGEGDTLVIGHHNGDVSLLATHHK